MCGNTEQREQRERERQTETERERARAQPQFQEIREGVDKEMLSPKPWGQPSTRMSKYVKKRSARTEIAARADRGEQEGVYGGRGRG